MRANDQPEEFTTVAQLRQETQNLAARGTTCPVCDQTVKQYPRTINKSMALALITAAKRFGVQPFKPIDALPQHGNTDFAKLRFWGLITPVADADGYWTITDAGMRFARGETSVTRYAVLYNNNLVMHGGPQVLIHQCMDRHDFEKLWGFDTIAEAKAEGESLCGSAQQLHY